MRAPLHHAVLAALLATAAACGSGGDDVAETGTAPTTVAASDSGDSATTTTAPGETEATGDAFYVPPDPLPGTAPGDLIRAEVVEQDIVEATVLRVLYRSESVRGDPIAVSGIVAIPEGPIPEGGRTVVSWAHGTTGIADECAPSRDPESAGLGLVAPFIERGWVFAATDYEGLGTPGRHPYIAGISEARGTIDIVRAARQIEEAAAGTRYLVWGHSQGGHAAMFANQIATEWAPELEQLGTVAGAPPSELLLINAALQGSPFQGYIAMAAAGLNAAYPEADLSLVMTQEAIELLDSVVDTGCTSAVFDAFNPVPYEEFAVADPAEVEPWRSILEENDPGHVRTDIPILIIHGEADEQIPVAASAILFDRMCGLGQVIERRTYPDQSHAGVIVPSLPDMLSWMDDRDAGQPAVSACPPG